ncbi:MAG: hypothetical protein IKS48_04005 [Eubacterium sp.]|nr:hypothetical protein [Eubacterium sp.]
MVIVDIMFIMVGMFLATILILWGLLKFKGKIVFGVINECNVSETAMSNIKVEVDSKIIKSKKYGNLEVGTRVKLIKYKSIYVTEDILSVMIPFVIYVSIPLGLLLIVRIFSPSDDTESEIAGKTVAKFLSVVLFGIAGLINYYFSKKIKEQVEYIKTGGKYLEKKAVIVEKQKKKNDITFIAEFEDNGNKYRKGIWTSALKNSFRMGESVDIYVDISNEDSNAYVSFEKRDNEKETLLKILAIVLILLGIIGAILI